MTILDILSAVCHHYDVPLEAVLGRSRRAALVRARHMTILLAWRFLDVTMTSIGQFFSYSDHSPVSYAINKLWGLGQAQPDLTAEIEYFIFLLHRAAYGH